MSNASPAPFKCPSCGAQASGAFCNSCGAKLAASACPVCKEQNSAGSRFCSSCGSSLAADARESRALNPAAGAAGGPPRTASYVPWTIAGVVLVGVAAYFAGRGLAGNSTEAMASTASVAPFANGNPGATTAPDIGNMSPRERASRLYDRIMRYVEEGKKDSAQFFAPMALGSFEMLGPELDTDARYDYGRVASETGNLPIAAAQADTILKESPNHLLGLALAARTATASGDTRTATARWKQFLSVRDSELKKNLPEYEMHARDIDLAAKLAQGK